MNDFSRSWARCTRWLLAAMLWAIGAGAAFGFTAPPNFIGTTYEGCRNNGSITLPIAGQFICPDSAYTSGNLGKGWNELDLVPFHLITSSGNSAGASTTYNIYIAADYRQGTLGYDFISVPTVNPVSDASCAVSAGPQTVVTGITGGTEDTAYRELTITQTKGKTCRFDWYQRLALGASQFNGSNLQAYIFDKVDLSGGKRTIPIPVNQILPQSLRKDMSASAGSNFTWNLTKTASPANADFGDVCTAADVPLPQAVKVRVEWVKSEAVAGNVTVTTNIYAKNPAARTVTVDVTDVIYKGTDQSTPLPNGTLSSGPKDVPANTESLVLTHTGSFPPGDAGLPGASLNDVATATYTDKVTGQPVPGNTTAKAAAVIAQGPVGDSTANVADLEKIDLTNPNNTGLSFSVASLSAGSTAGGFVGYTLGTKANEVNWGETGLATSGFVEFNKLIYLDGKRIVNGGVMSDVATLYLTDPLQTVTAGPILVSISSSATAKLTINKNFSGVTLGAGEKLVFNFHISSTTDSTYSADRSITILEGQASGSVVVSGLAPGLYVVTEGDTRFYASVCNDDSCALTIPLQDTTGPTRNVDLQATINGPTCTGSASFHNEPQGGTVPVAKVQKLTVPAIPTSTSPVPGSWEFKLYAPGGSLLATKNAVPNAGFVDFGVALSFDGTYTVVETAPVAGWDLTSAIPNNGTATKVCSFNVNLPQDLNHVPFQCTFTNTQQGKARVIKTVSGRSLVATESFTFELRQGATTTAQGTTLATATANANNLGTINFSPYLTPGATYQICEQVLPGWNTNLSGDSPLFVPESVIAPALPNPNVNNMTLCANFTVAAGQTRTFNVNNSPPPTMGGRRATIGFWKNWASCKKSGGSQAPTLDQTLFGYLPNGIVVGNVKSVTSAHLNAFALFGETGGATAKTADCPQAVSLLSKNNFNGDNKSSDPLFNMAAQLVAAELNVAAQAGVCVVPIVNQANALLTKYGFNGTGYTVKLSAPDSNLANSLAKQMDDYNNDRPSGCQ